MNKIILSILCIISLAAAMPAHAAWYNWIPGASWFFGSKAQNRVSLTIPRIVMESQFNTRYEVNLKDDTTGKKLGDVHFSYNSTDKSGNIDCLHVLKTERNHSYGSMLFKDALEKLSAHNCTGIYWQAYPFDLKSNQTHQDMLPKLIAFYQRHGAQVIRKDSISAEMAYYPRNAPQSIFKYPTKQDYPSSTSTLQRQSMRFD